VSMCERSSPLASMIWYSSSTPIVSNPSRLMPIPR
jgi:hypothetical protein